MLSENCAKYFTVGKDEPIFAGNKDIVSGLDYFYVIHGAVEVVLEKVIKGVSEDPAPLREYNL